MSRRPLCIMAFGAHPPDIIFNAGGTLAKHAGRGDEVIAVCLTDGTRHLQVLGRQPVIGPEAIRKLAGEKRDEMQLACQAMGVQHVRFLGLRDSPLEISQANLRAVSDVIRKFEPDVILSHHPQETFLTGHTDHGDAGNLVMRGFMMAFELGFESYHLPHMANSVYLYALRPGTEGPDLAPMATPALYVDISDVIEAKKQALLAIAPTMGMTEESIDASIAAGKGKDKLTHVDHAEGFYPLHTPVIDYFERRTKGRWLHWSRPADWDTLELWPDENTGGIRSHPTIRFSE